MNINGVEITIGEDNLTDALFNGSPLGAFGSYTKAEARKAARVMLAGPELLEALKDAQKMLKTASRYFPKSIKNRDRFDLLNTLANSVNTAIDKAKDGAQ